MAPKNTNTVLSSNLKSNIEEDDSYNHSNNVSYRENDDNYSSFNKLVKPHSSTKDLANLGRFSNL